MTTLSEILGTRTALTATGLGTLASASYVASNAYDCSANGPLDVLLEVELATTNAIGGNKQAVIFAQASLDGTNFESGPTSGTTATDEPDLTFVGVVPIYTSTTTHRKIFSMREAFGSMPKAFKIIVKNDVGVALTSGALYTSEVVGSAV